MNLAGRLKPNHLRLLLEIAESGKLQFAASSLAMSQPAASRILAEIESHVGAALFERHPKGMIPTPVGSAFIRHARVILGEIKNLQAEVTELNFGTTGEVRVGSVTGPAVGCLVPAIQKVKATAPGIKVTVEIAPSTQLMRGLDAEQFDFVIARLPETSESRDFHITPARNEVISLLVRRGHPQAARKKVRIAELTGYEWVIQERGTPVRRAVENTFHAADVATPADITNSSSLLVALSFLAKSDAIAPQSQEVVDLLIGEGIRSELATIDLVESITVFPYYIITSRSRKLHPAAARVFNEVLARL